MLELVLPFQTEKCKKKKNRRRKEKKKVQLYSAFLMRKLRLPGGMGRQAQVWQIL